MGAADVDGVGVGNAGVQGGVGGGGLRWPSSGSRPS